MATYLGLDLERFGRVIPAVAASGTNTSIAITLAAQDGMRHHLMGVLWSYSGAPTGGRLSTTGLEGDELDIDITAGGPGAMLLPPAVSTRGGQVVVTLADGGAGVVGKLTVFSVPVPG